MRVLGSVTECFRMALETKTRDWNDLDRAILMALLVHRWMVYPRNEYDGD